MVEVKTERRSSGRLVSKRIILSEDEEKNNSDLNHEDYPENYMDNGNRPRRKTHGIINSNSNSSFLDDEEFVPRKSSRRKEIAVSDESGNENESEEEHENNSKKSRRDRVEELRERRNNRGKRMRESEKLMSNLIEMETTESRRKSARNKMEEEDAALAAAISAGYFSDEERETEHVRLRNGTRFKDDLANPTSTNTTPTYNPYARNGLGAYTGPMRRSGRSAAVVSAARVALYSSMLNPDSSVHMEEPPAEPKYNLRPNRPSVEDHNAAAAAAAAYYEFQDRSGIDTSTNLSRLFEEDDVDGHHVDNSGGSGEVSLAALDKIVGMDGYVTKLKEMIVFPLIYPHLFSKLNISLPRGVLFHGPPGTGKTLMARLLASACSTSTRKVSFFMRNGSDCLSKWIGEAERNMRLLFKKAKECQPSIIFFDEIDGLAPERTGRQDQSHISLVSTLLALMDGLDDRGQVVVIGATNRIHSIDAALRRPGRFDREFYFGLPDESARAKILKIHTKTWEPPIEDALAADLASRTSGYSGADMKALCVEAALRAVQRTFPEVYESTAKIEMDESENCGVKVNSSDFEYALMHLTPSNRRHVSQFDLVSLQKPQSLLYTSQSEELKRLLLQPNLKKNITNDASGKVTWQILEPLTVKILYDGASHPESFVWRFVCGIGDGLDGFAVHPVDLMTLRDDASGFEASLWRGLNDARLKGGAFCVLFKSFNGLEKSERSLFTKTLKRFTNSLMPGEPVILIFTCRNGKEGENNLTGGGIKKFRLAPPTEEQTVEYLQFVLRSVYRILSSERPPKLSESDFIKEFKFPECRGVMEMERFRMQIGDAIRSEAETYFGREIFEAVEAIDSENFNSIDSDSEGGKAIDSEGGKAIDSDNFNSHDSGNIIDHDSENVNSHDSQNSSSPDSENVNNPESEAINTIYCEAANTIDSENVIICNLYHDTVTVNCHIESDAPEEVLFK